MKQMILLGFILLTFSGCIRRTPPTPTLDPIYVQLEKLTDCNTTYVVGEDGNVTLTLDAGKCIVNKLRHCLRDRKKLGIANMALNSQILLSNQLSEH